MIFNGLSFFSLPEFALVSRQASHSRCNSNRRGLPSYLRFFGMKAHIGVDAESGLVHTVRGTAGNVNDVVEANALLHGDEIDGFGDAGYQGVHKRPDARESVTWHIAMHPGKRKALDKTRRSHQLIDKLERLKAGIRSKVEPPFRVIKRQFG